MTCKSPLFYLTLLGATAVTAWAQDSAETPAAAAAPTEATAPAVPELTDAQKLNIYGWLMGYQAGLSDLDLSAAEITALSTGVAAAARGEELAYDLTVVGPAMSAFIQEKQSLYLAKLREREMVKAAAFMKAVKEKEGVVALDSGLAYMILEEGTGEKPTANSRVRVNYTGVLTDGTPFDSTEGGEPYETSLQGVIPGWTEGMQHVREGGTIQLYIPPHLAYGDRGSGSIPPGAALVFDVELLEILPAAPAATE